MYFFVCVESLFSIYCHSNVWGKFFFFFFFFFFNKYAIHLPNVTVHTFTLLQKNLYYYIFIWTPYSSYSSNIQTSNFLNDFWHWKLEKWLLKILRCHQRSKNVNRKCILNCNISQYYCFFFFEQINAALVSPKGFFQTYKKSYWLQTFER